MFPRCDLEERGLWRLVTHIAMSPDLYLSGRWMFFTIIHTLSDCCTLFPLLQPATATNKPWPYSPTYVCLLRATHIGHTICWCQVCCYCILFDLKGTFHWKDCSFLLHLTSSVWWPLKSVCIDYIYFKSWQCFKGVGYFISVSLLICRFNLFQTLHTTLLKRLIAIYAYRFFKVKRKFFVTFRAYGPMTGRLVTL